MLGIEEIRAARELLAGVALHTPVLDSRTFSDATGGTVLFKAENLQKTGPSRSAARRTASRT